MRYETRLRLFLSLCPHKLPKRAFQLPIEKHFRIVETKVKIFDKILEAIISKVDGEYLASDQSIAIIMLYTVKNNYITIFKDNVFGFMC